MKKTLAALLFLSAGLVGCTAPAPEAEQSVPAANSIGVTSQNDEPVDRFNREIGDSKGVIVLSDKYGEDDTIRIYNKGGSLWYEFSYYDESAFDDLESINTDFKPFAFHPDYLLLAMRVVGEDSALYEVVVNEESDLRKFVRKNDENLKYEDFGALILTVYAIDFDTGTNTPRNTPGGEAVTADYTDVKRFKPEEVDGDWLRISWSKPAAEKGDAAADPGTGWIRWRRGSKLLVELFYIK